LSFIIIQSDTNDISLKCILVFIDWRVCSPTPELKDIFSPFLGVFHHMKLTMLFVH